jgi:hypothetical protein
MYDNINVGIKIAFLIVCLVITFGGHYPPSHAQMQTVQIPVVTNEDVKQDTNIDLINQHLNATDARLQREAERSDNNALDIAGMKGEERIIGAVLTLLSGVSIVLQVRRKDKV